MGFEGFEVKESILVGYIATDEYNQADCEALIGKYAGLGKAQLLSAELLAEVNWNEEWEKNFDPVVVAERILIRAPFHDVEGEFDYEILIEPKMAFGTGHHETTFMVLKEMLDMNFEGKEVLDYGCGTGILAVLADMKKAKRVDAIDYDENAVRNALEIASNNGTTIVEISIGDRTYLKGKKYDVILANINKNVLKESMMDLRAVLRPKGALLMSGILGSDKQEMMDLSAKSGFRLKSQHEKGQWVLLVYTIG